MPTRRRLCTTAALAFGLAAAGLGWRARAADSPVPPIVQAAGRGDAPAVERALAAGTDPNAARDDGRTALMEAARIGRHDIARSLLVHGAARDQKDRAGRTAFDHAVDGHHSDLIALLRDAS